MALPIQILIALVLAAIAGTISGTTGQVFGISALAVFDFIGTLFLNALKMIVIPLVVSAIILGVTNLGGQGGFGRVGLKTLGYYLTTGFIAVVIGLSLVNLIKPGVSDAEPPQLEANAQIMMAVEGRDSGDLVEIFLRMVPDNIFAAAVEMQMLGLIFFSIVFGFFLSRISGPGRDTMQNFWQGLFDVMMLITQWVMKFAPYGVFGLVAAAIARTGFEQFGSLAWFFVTVVLALATHFLIVMPLILRFVGGVRSPWQHYRAMAPALLTAFSTSSSASTLPVTLANIEQRVGVSNRVSRFVLPLGATVNMDGTALFECVAVLFIAQLFGVELSFSQQVLVVVLALATSIGVAGIPSASLVAISVILLAVGLPLEALGLLLVVDRLLDMMRTSVNIFSDSVGAVVVANLEGEAASYPISGN
jgi:DAACS family dicarboxylate/amino acid:cation (Na+ or H+) symporter